MTKFKDRYNFKATKHLTILSYVVTTLGVLLICCFLFGENLKEPQKHKVLECYMEGGDNRCILWNMDYKETVSNLNVTPEQYKEYSVNVGKIVEHSSRTWWVAMLLMIVTSCWGVYTVWFLTEKLHNL